MPTNLVKFRDLGLSDVMLESLRKKGFEEPSPIQAKAIPFLLENKKDLIGKAQTGTGKTAAFGIPLIEKLMPGSKHVQAIILAPTRELAIQVAEEIATFAEAQKTRIVAIYGGQPIDRHIARLQRGVDIVVGTPGRVMDHLNRGTLNISKVSHIILDEADEMLNMGFIDDIETILEAAPKERRTVLFSATMPSHIERLAKKYMNDYEVISVMSGTTNRDNIQQIYFEVAQSDKFEALFRIIDVEESFYGLVFCRTKLDADDIAQKLTNRGCRAEALHGDISQGQREKILQKFRSKKLTVLVATDVAARGIDVENLTHVINYALPQDPESYVHRIGRTGRAGKSGTAITLITPSEYRKLVTIQKMANTTITKQTVPNVKDVVNSKKQRIKNTLADIIATGGFADLEVIAEEILLNTDGSAELTDPKVVLAALLKLAFKDELNERSYNEINIVGGGGAFKKDRYSPREGGRDFGGRDGGRDGGRGRDRDSGGRDFNRRDRDRDDDRDDYRPGGNNRQGYVDRKGTARLFIAKGRNDGMDPRKLVEFIQKESGVEQRKVDDVKIFDSFSFFAAPFEDAERILNSFQKNSSSGRSLVSRAKDKKPGGGFND